MANWSPRDPGAGDLTGLQHRMIRLQDHRDHASEMKRTVLQVADRLADDWSGDGYDAWTALASENGAAWLSLHHWADTEHDVLRRYTAAVESIKERAARQIALLDLARHDLTLVTGDRTRDDAARESEQLRVDAATRGLDALAEERREAESALARGLQEVRTAAFRVKSSRLPSPSRLRAMNAPELLTLLAALSPRELEKLLDRDPGLVDRLNEADPAEVAQWWSTLDHQQTLIDLVPSLVGALDGVPPLARVEANRIIAQRRIEVDTATLIGLGLADALVPGGSRANRRKIEQLEREMAYLRRVESGDVQLYLYDSDASRIIEMIGTPGPATTHVITYVPGTFTNLDSFYTNGVQQMARALHIDHQSSTVAFVYKDGAFPGGDDDGGEQNMARILEANDLATGLIAGKRLAKFESGLRATGLDNAQSTAIGHSWGLADVTSSEVAGARYDQVFSLSGAWAPPEWKPRAGTTYSDLSYDDILQEAGRWSLINNVRPRATKDFDSLPYFEGPGGMNQLDLHNLVATDSRANKDILRELSNGIFK